MEVDEARTFWWMKTINGCDFEDVFPPSLLQSSSPIHPLLDSMTMMSYFPCTCKHGKE